MTSDDVIGDVSTPPLEPDESGMARVTLRLPESLKQRIEDAAARHSLSVNSWLVRAVTAAVDPTSGPDPAAPARLGQLPFHRLGALTTPTSIVRNPIPSCRVRHGQ